MDEVNRWKSKLRKDPELAKDFTDALQQNSMLFAGSHYTVFRAIESILKVPEGGIDFHSVNSEELVKMICSEI